MTQSCYASTSCKVIHKKLPAEHFTTLLSESSQQMFWFQEFPGEILYCTGLPALQTLTFTQFNPEGCPDKDLQESVLCLPPSLDFVLEEMHGKMKNEYRRTETCDSLFSRMFLKHKGKHIRIIYGNLFIFYGIRTTVLDVLL